MFMFDFNSTPSFASIHLYEFEGFLTKINTRPKLNFFRQEEGGGGDLPTNFSST